MIGEDVQSPDEDKSAEDDEQSIQLERIEELKLISKYPQAKKAPVGSQFLQKRLQQRKFFDSGDYNMAKAKGLKLPVTDAQRIDAKLSMEGEGVAANKASAPSYAGAALRVSVGDRQAECSSPTGIEIPTPETVPLRKTSIVVTAGSKLSPQPLLHHSPTGNNPLPGSMDVCQV